MWILWRHILRAHVGPFFFSLVVLLLIFLLQFIVKFMDQLAGKGLAASVIAELTVLSLAWMVVLAVPMSVLVATLMAFGGMAAVNEITAMRTAGVSLYRMIAPVSAASVIVFVLLLLFNNEVLPDANYRTKVLMTDISRKKPTLSLVPGLFSQDVQGYSILVRKTFEHSNDLEGVTIFDFTKPDVQATVTAQHGTISFSPDYRRLIMDLRDGEINEINILDFQEYRKIRFEKHRIVMEAEGFDFQRSQLGAFSRGDRELSAAAMQILVDSLRVEQRALQSRIDEAVRNELDRILAVGGSLHGAAPSPDDPTFAAHVKATSLSSRIETQYSQLFYLERRIREYLVEIHKKYAIPVACIVFVFVGAPLGIMARRGTFGMAASLSLGFFLVYWACLIGGEKLADRGVIAPWVGMWVANIVIGLLGLYLTIRTAREHVAINWSLLTRFIPKQWRLEEEPNQR